MQFGKYLLSPALLLAIAALPCAARTHARRGPTGKHSKAPSRPAPQRAIDDSRATQIQGSLIKSGYLTGEASGHWDAQTEAAMQKFQSDNGWQTKLIPDSRAIIKLGLGPNQDTEVGSASADASSLTSSNAEVMQR
jgi:peptidoglycan hydrolase-like protein with peptidoglycan-binding domain